MNQPLLELWILQWGATTPSSYHISLEVFLEDLEFMISFTSWVWLISVHQLEGERGTVTQVWYLYISLRGSMEQSHKYEDKHHYNWALYQMWGTHHHYTWRVPHSIVCYLGGFGNSTPRSLFWVLVPTDILGCLVSL